MRDGYRNGGRAVRWILAAWACGLGGASAIAADYSLSGFGTLGYAASDQKAPYLRYIDSNGTLKADSLIGLQGEAQLDPQWGATVQVVASAPRYRDEGVAAQLRWAFVSYRPNNDWMIRLGRMRVPFLLNTQNSEVGVTYDRARLPAEVYSVSPFYDADGIVVNRNWSSDGSETNAHAYVGKASINYRLPFQRPATQLVFPSRYVPEQVRVTGMVLTRSSGPWQLQAGWHKATLKPDVPQVDRSLPVEIPAPAPAGGTLYVPGTLIDRFQVTILTAGAEWTSDKWRVTAEYAQRISKDIDWGPGSKSAQVLVSREFGKWVPYVGYARLFSAADNRKLYHDANTTPVPLLAQGAPLFVSPQLHQIIADGTVTYDQYSTMVGASYSLSNNSKLKFEWMRTKIGLVSALVDGDIHNKRFNVFSVSYSFAF